MMKSPYIVPEGNVLISLSGGRTSAFMLWNILEANGGLPDNAKVVFANTGREMPETLDFVQECSQHWNVPITWVEYTRVNNKATYQIVSHNSAARNGEPFAEMLDAKKYMPSAVQRFCTQELKVRSIKRFLVEQGWKKWTSTIGIRADEMRRVKASIDNRWENWYPLVAAHVTRDIIGDFWKAQSFDLRLTAYRGAAAKGNCDGCFLKSEATLAMMWREHPDRMQWWADMEAKSGRQFHKTRSYAKLGEFVNAQSDWIFDNEAVLCQKDGGDCTG
jgi:3'-phosphoadenosine 5'-phosphosulfate sulfotransferase (PAPS reductase)/FAD synthetase